MAGYIGSKASVVSSGAEHKKLFNITTTTTSLTGLVYTPTLVHVFHNGVRLVDGTDYTATNGTSITLTVAAENGDQVAVVSYATFQTSDTVSASAGGTFGNNVSVTGTLAATAVTGDGSGLTSLASANLTGTVTVSGSNVNFAGNATANGNGNVEIKATTTSNAYSYLTMGTWGLDRGQIRTEAANPGAGSGTGSGVMSFWTAQNPTMTEVMRISPIGDLLLGTTSNLGSAKFVVEQDTATANPMAVSNSRSTASTDYSILFYRNSSIVGSVQTSLSATSYVTSSDYRLKEDWQLMSGASERVLALKPVNFAWKLDGSRVDGFLAHEAQAVVPECVTGTKDAMRDEEYEVTAAVLDADGMVVTEAVMGTRSVPDYQGIDQSKLVPLLTAALQEALNKIDAMEIRLAALEAV